MSLQIFKTDPLFVGLFSFCSRCGAQYPLH
jgi:hypothetical protein